MADKKVVLFIVEGANDQIALAKSLDNLLSSESVNFQITEGDITGDKQGKGIKAKVGDVIRQHCMQYKLKSADILETVLLLDMDGAYIAPDKILYSSDHSKPFYKEDTLLTGNPNALYETHLGKQRNLNILIGTEEVMNIPFSVYFFSCNLDHVICNDANLAQSQKREEAGRFENKYYKNSTGFLAFFQGKEIASESSYPESWKTIKEDTNSLKRRSNLNIFLSLDAKCIPRDFSHLND